MSEFVEDVRKAVHEGRLPPIFTAKEVQAACPRWVKNSAGVSL